MKNMNTSGRVCENYENCSLHGDSGGGGSGDGDSGDLRTNEH